MKEHQDVKHYIEVVSDPESLESVASSILCGKHINDDCYQSQYKRTKARHCKEEPVGKLWQNVGAAVNFPEDACQVTRCLGGNVVEIDSVTNTVHNCEQQSCEGNNLVETDVGIEGNVVVEYCFTQVGNEVSRHCQQKH